MPPSIVVAQNVIAHRRSSHRIATRSPADAVLRERARHGRGSNGISEYVIVRSGTRHSGGRRSARLQ
jgi:hypothetical protein